MPKGGRSSKTARASSNTRAYTDMQKMRRALGSEYARFIHANDVAELRRAHDRIDTYRDMNIRDLRAAYEDMANRHRQSSDILDSLRPIARRGNLTRAGHDARDTAISQLQNAEASMRAINAILRSRNISPIEKEF